MSFNILLSVLLGIGFGYFILPSGFLEYTGTIIDIGLCVLLFFVGMDLGRQKDFFQNIKELGYKMIFVPFGVIIGGVLGGIIGGMVLHIPLGEAAAVSSGLGWYTLSSIMLADYSNELSVLAFLVNVLREVIALIAIPFVAKHIGFIESVSMCGATAMDTSLPVLSKFTDSNTTVISFVTGVISTISVPVILPIILNILGG